MEIGGNWGQERVKKLVFVSKGTGVAAVLCSAEQMSVELTGIAFWHCALTAGRRIALPRSSYCRGTDGERAPQAEPSF